MRLQILASWVLLFVIALDADAFPRFLLFRRRIEPPCPPTVIVEPPRAPLPVGIPDRNPVNLLDRNLPTDWSVEPGKLKNIKWSADIGKSPFGSPVIARGAVFVGVNDVRDAMGKGRYAAMRALRELDGKVLWQNLHDYPEGFQEISDLAGNPSNPTVDGARLYYITPACELICASCDTGKVHWRYDAVKEFKVFYTTFWPAPPLGSPLIVGDAVFFITGNGRDVDGKLVAPDAPSFVALDKVTGRLLWTSILPGKRVIEGQWSSPCHANVGGVSQVIFPGGDSVIYSFEPATGRLLWKCDCAPFAKAAHEREIDKYFVAAPVVVGDRLYVGLGMTVMNARATRWSWFLSLDITKRGDVSIKSTDPKSPANAGSALVWAFGGPILPAPPTGRQAYVNSIISAPAVRDGLIYLCEESGYLHCLDAATGKRHWEHAFRSMIWGAPYWVDGKVYVGTEDGEVVIFGHRQTKKVLARVEMDYTLMSTPVAANGVLYVMPRSRLYAIAAP